MSPPWQPHACPYQPHIASEFLSASISSPNLLIQPECKNLVAVGPGEKVFFLIQINNEEPLDSYWSVSAALTPWFMVLPSTDEDVSTIIKTLVLRDCTFGVRTSGHGSFALSNSVEHGVTIDSGMPFHFLHSPNKGKMRVILICIGNMNRTTYDRETKIISLQPGGRWQNYGMTVTGGRKGVVGVGGFLTGGGNSFHSASHGMGWDTVANFQIVVQNGSIINANAKEHPDLWVALKGGSVNFGLVI